MLLIVVPAGLDGAWLGDGLEPPPEEPAGEAAGEPVELEGVGEALEAAAFEVVLVGTEAVPPHPVIVRRTVPASPTLRSLRGMKRICRF